jgi:hypothetical protein
MRVQPDILPPHMVVVGGLSISDLRIGHWFFNGGENTPTLALALAGAVTIIAWRESESQAVILLTSVYLVYTDNSATIKTL